MKYQILKNFTDYILVKKYLNLLNAFLIIHGGIENG